MRKSGSDGQTRLAFRLQQTMRGNIGIMDGNAQSVHHRRNGRFPHADRTGKAQNDHRVTISVSSSVTSGIIPCQRENAGRA